MKPPISGVLTLAVSTVAIAMVLAGCGIGGSSSAVSLGHGAGHISATTKISTFKTPSSTDQAAIGPSSSELVDETLQWLSSRTSLSLAGPVLLPNPTSGDWVAQAKGNAQGYQIKLWNVIQPLGINSPYLAEDTRPTSPVVSFGIMQLSSGMLAPGAPGYLTPLQQHNLSWMTLSPTNGTPVILGTAVTGFRYTAVQGTVVDWAMGAWTLQVSGDSSGQEIQVAKPVISYLKTHKLPADPGILAIRLTGNGATTMIDWINGRQLSWVQYASDSGTNTVGACAMAVSWRILPDR